MAWEWVAPVAAAAATSIVGTTTWLAAASGRKHAERVARENHQHERQLEAEKRRAVALAETYVQLLEVVERAGGWAASVYPMMDVGQPVPELPPAEEQTRARARLRAHGSPRVLALFEEYVDLLNEMIGHYVTILMFERRQADPARANIPSTDVSDLESRRALDMELRPKERAKRREIGQAVAEELRGTATGERLRPSAVMELPSSSAHPRGARFPRPVDPDAESA